MKEEAIEQEIRNVVATALNGIVSSGDIITLPESISEFKRPFSGALIVVGYQMSDYDETYSVSSVTQPELMSFVLTMQSRTLRGAMGIYTLKSLIKDAIVGYKPNHCTHRIWAKHFGPPKDFDPFADGIWTYELHVCTKSVLVQKIAQPDNGVVSSYQSSTTQTTTTSPTPIISL